MRVSLLAIVLNLSLSTMKFIMGALIVWAACQILKDAIDKMVDRAGPEELTEQIDRMIREQQGVERVDDIKTRLFAARLYVDVEIAPPARAQGV